MSLIAPAKRFSAVGVGRVYILVVSPDGDISDGDRQTMAHSYTALDFVDQEQQFTGGNQKRPPRRTIIKDKDTRREVDEYFAEQARRRLEAQIQEEDEELIVIMMSIMHL
jgi:hypothetical protein